MRLLVVEDEKDMNHILVSKLEKEGYNVEIGRASCRERV